MHDALSYTTVIKCTFPYYIHTLIVGVPITCNPIYHGTAFQAYLFGVHSQAQQIYTRHVLCCNHVLDQLCASCVPVSTGYINQCMVTRKLYMLCVDIVCYEYFSPDIFWTGLRDPKCEVLLVRLPFHLLVQATGLRLAHQGGRMSSCNRNDILQLPKSSGHAVSICSIYKWKFTCNFMTWPCWDVIVQGMLIMPTFPPSCHGHTSHVWCNRYIAQ